MSKKYSNPIANHVGVDAHIDPKTKNAITLIALIITIIILLILAGVSLSLVVGENGIVSRAIKARKIQGISVAKEQLELEIANLSNEFYQAKFLNSEISGDMNVGDYIIEKLKIGEFEDQLLNVNSFFEKNKKIFELIFGTTKRL